MKTINSLWEQVMKKYGKHSYRLAIDGLGRLVLCKGYGETIAIGKEEIKEKLETLLNA